MKSNDDAKAKGVLHPKPKPSSRKHHGKLRWRRHCRIQLPFPCAARIFKLTNKLGLKSHAKTIEWMLSQLDQNASSSNDSDISAGNARIIIPESYYSNPLSSSVTSCLPEAPAAEDENYNQVFKTEALPPNPENNGSGDGEWPECFSPEDVNLLRSVFKLDS